MGRKRDKGFDAASKRRTIIQIEKPYLKSEHRDSPGHGASSQPKAAHNPLGLLASYGDSDDEGLDEDAPTPPRQTKAGFIGVDGTKPKNEMDEKVADFLAEIDALDPDTPEHSSEPASTAETNDTLPAAAAAEPVAAAAPPPAAAPLASPHVAPVDNGGWQELLDENTNCIYYWNTISNEVTWEMPPGFQSIDMVEQVPSQPSSGIATPTQPEEPPVEPEEAPPPQLAKEEPQAEEVSEPKKAAVKEVNTVKEEVTKKVPSKAPSKPPVLDMFADDVEEEEEDTQKTASNKGSRKMPVYGALKAEYEVESEEVEDNKSEPELEPEPPKAKVKKPGAYSMFVKGDTLPGFKEKKKKSSKKSGEAVVLAHLDITDDGDSEESHTNGASDAGKTSGNNLEEDDDVIEMDVGDDIDIDQQLELALERKKAELAQLEEIEKGSSSPAQKRKISSPLSIYDEKGEVNLLSFKKKRLENLKGQRQVSTCDQGTQCDEELEKMAVNDEKFKSVKKAKEDANLKKELADLGSTLTSKLEFLGQSRKGLSKLQILLVEIETRVLDWREGALDGKHLLRKLQIADWELQQHESEAVPPGWTCTWNRTHKQYYYTNSVTGESQWDYPAEALTKEEEKRDQSMDEKENRALFNRASSQDDSEARARGSSAMLHGSVTSGQLNIQGIASLQSSSTTLPVINTVAPPPPAVPSPEPPPPPLPDDAPPLPNDPPPPGTGPDLPPLPPSPPPLPPSPPLPEDSEDDDDSDSPSRPMTPPPLPPFTTAPASHFGAPPPPPEPDGTVIGKPQLLYTNAPSAGAVISRPPEVAGIDGMPVGDYGGAPVTYGSQQAAPAELVAGGTQAMQSTSTTKTKKTRKVKKSSSTVKKKMPLSLVEKWKQIQEAQAKEEEEKRRKEEEEEMVLDPSVITQRRIEEWKKQQLEEGRKSYNPNFETIKGDWRERLKRKGTKQ